MNLGLIAIAIGGIGLLTWLYFRDQAQTKSGRSVYFDECITLVQQPEVTLDSFGYPKLSGFFNGHNFQVDLIVDSLGVRKLPSLWLRVTLLAPLDTSGMFDVMMRPLGSEFFSNFNDLPHRIERPSSWPEPAVIRCDDMVAGDVLTKLPERLPFMHEKQFKEMVITRNGIRLVVQADEAERGTYLMLRQSRFNKGPIPTQLMRPLLNQCLHLHNRINEPEKESNDD